jgi:hypothetical protein
MQRQVSVHHGTAVLSPERVDGQSSWLDRSDGFIDGRTTRCTGLAESQLRRRLVEEGSGWGKTIGDLRKLHAEEVSSQASVFRSLLMQVTPDSGYRMHRLERTASNGQGPVGAPSQLLLTTNHSQNRLLHVPPPLALFCIPHTIGIYINQAA